MSKVAKAATGLMLATLLAKVLGFGRELALGASYGVSAYTDAFIVAFNIPTIIFASVGSALATTYIPLYFEVENTKGKSEASKFLNNIINIIVIICIIISIIGIVFTEPLVKIFAVGFKAETLNIAIGFTKILIPSVIFIGLTYIMTAYLQINGNFTIPGLISIPKNIIIIVSIFLSVKFNSNIIAYGTLIAIASEFLVQLPFAIKKGYKYQAYLDVKDKNLIKLLILIIPIFIGVAVGQINAMIDRTLASTLVEGSITALNYANKLNSFVVGIFIVSISAVIYPTMSKLSTENNKKKFGETIVKSINSIVLLVLPVSVGAIVLAEPIVRILFQRGAFDEQATKMTAIALVYYSLGLVAMGLVDILGKAFYSLKDTRTPMINGIITVGINIILNFILIRYLKHAGLALATSVASISGVIILFIALRKKVGYFGEEKIIKSLVKCLIASILMGIMTSFIHTVLITRIGYDIISQILILGISIIAGAIVYFIFTLILKVDEVYWLINLIKQKLNKK